MFLRPGEGCQLLPLALGQWFQQVRVCHQFSLFHSYGCILNLTGEQVVLDVRYHVFVDISDCASLPHSKV